jgi:hypothetical protein
MESTEKPTQKAIDTGGGAYVGGSVNTGGGDFVGRDKVVHGDEVRGHKAGGDLIVGTVAAGAQNVAIGRNISQDIRQAETLEHSFESLIKAVQAAPVDIASEAMPLVLELRNEVARGKEADDFAVAELIERFHQVAPKMSDKLLVIFTSPLVAGIEGPATRYVLRRLEHSLTLTDGQH